MERTQRTDPSAKNPSEKKGRSQHGEGEEHELWEMVSGQECGEGDQRVEFEENPNGIPNFIESPVAGQ